jgi:hypothetical protein
VSNSLNLQEIGQEQAANISKLFINSGENLLLLGRRGTGKTQLLMQSVKDCGYKIIYINLSVIERCDLLGYPDMFNSSETVDFKSPNFLPKANGKKPDTVLFFDEIDKCSSDITAPLLEILQFKKINGSPLNAAACILTGNLIEEGAYSNQISSAILDRCAKYVLKFDLDYWIEWAKVNDVHDLIVSFLIANPELACGEPETTYYATPSPRGWTLASQALWRAKELKMTDIQTVSSLIAGYVGYEASLRFETWYRFYRKFEPIIHSLFEFNESNFDYDSLMPTEKLVFCITACHLAKLKIQESAKNKSKYLETLCFFFDKHQVDIETQLISLRNSFPVEFVTKHKLYSNKVFLKKFEKIQDVIKK